MLKIEIPVHEPGTPQGSPSEELRERLERTPTKSAEELAEALAEKDKKRAQLRAIHLESVKMNAMRENERAKEGVARRLRLEAAAQTRAVEKIESANGRVEKKEAEKNAKRAAERQRRTALLAAVREAREARAVARRSRMSELAELETKAACSRTKNLMAVVDKSKMVAKHALAVAAAHKEKQRQAAVEHGTELRARLDAAASRRASILFPTDRPAAVGPYGLPVSGPALAGPSAADRARAEWLNTNHVELGEKRVRLAAAMKKALDRRAQRLAAISSKAGAANAHAAEVAVEVKLAKKESKAARQQMHARLQAAEYNRLAAQKKRRDARGGYAPSTPEAQEAAAPATPPKPEAPFSWMGPEGGVGRRRPTPASPAKKPSEVLPPVAIFIPTTDLMAGAPALPRPGLLARLLFKPRMQLATAPSRHANAEARRITARHLRTAKLSHYNSVRMAVVLGRKAAAAEMKKSVYETICKVATERAAEAVHMRALTAAKANRRVLMAALRRSSLRFDKLTAAIDKEEAMVGSARRRAKRMADIAAGRWAKAAAAAAAARREAADCSRLANGEKAARRGLEVMIRRDAIISEVVVRAKLSATPRSVPVKLQASGPAGKLNLLMKPSVQPLSVMLKPKAKSSSKKKPANSSPKSPEALPILGGFAGGPHEGQIPTPVGEGESLDAKLEKVVSSTRSFDDKPIMC